MSSSLTPKPLFYFIYFLSLSHLHFLHNIKAGNWYRIFLFLIKLVICAYVRHLVNHLENSLKKRLSKRITKLGRTAAGHFRIACELPQVITEGTFTGRERETALSWLYWRVNKQTKKDEFHQKILPKSSKKLPIGCETRAQPYLHGEMFKIEEESFFSVFECNSSISVNVAGLAEQIKVGTVNAMMLWALIYKQARMESAHISEDKSAELIRNWCNV